MTRAWRLGLEGPAFCARTLRDDLRQKRIDELFAQHVGTLDMARRKAAYRDMSVTLNEDCFATATRDARHRTAPGRAK